MNGIRTSSHPGAAQKAFRRGTSAASARKHDVLDLIEKNFERFDRDGSGHITWKEMRGNIADPSIQGKDAAALATLYSLTLDSSNEQGRVRPKAVTLDDLSELKDDKEFQSEEGEPVAADLYYERYLKKLENASNTLFAGGLPNGFQVAQGYGPSCAILAVTVAQARINPAVIQEAVRELEDGRVSVKFPGIRKPQVIERCTDTETALFATAGQNGTWLNHIEKAWGAMQDAPPGAAFEQSSWPAKAIRAWSGGDATTISVPEEARATRKGRVPAFMADAVKHLTANHIVMAWTRHGERALGNLVPGHAHTVLGFDADRGVVELRQPWGHREPLDKNGKARDGRDDGIFEVTLQEYVHDFGRMSFQTSTRKSRDAALRRSPAGTTPAAADSDSAGD